VHSTGPGMVGCSPLSGSDYPDATQTQRRPPPPHPEDVVQGAELAVLSQIFRVDMRCPRM
jgi:hypothetical protein